jgi:hypothetical protein
VVWGLKPRERDLLGEKRKTISGCAAAHSKADALREIKGGRQKSQGIPDPAFVVWS